MEYGICGYEVFQLEELSHSWTLVLSIITQYLVHDWRQDLHPSYLSRWKCKICTFSWKTVQVWFPLNPTGQHVSHLSIFLLNDKWTKTKHWKCKTFFSCKLLKTEIIHLPHLVAHLVNFLIIVFFLIIFFLVQNLVVDHW